MGTRADFYVGRGEKAEWLGSTPFDGYPEGIEQAVLGAKTESDFREAVTSMLAEDDNATTPDMGWPWPWEDSRTTDFAYAFDDGTVWGSCFGSTWVEATAPEDEWPDDKGATFPAMDTETATFGPRSGLLIFGAEMDPS